MFLPYAVAICIAAEIRLVLCVALGFTIYKYAVFTHSIVFQVFALTKCLMSEILLFSIAQMKRRITAKAINVHNVQNTSML